MSVTELGAKYDQAFKKAEDAKAKAQKACEFTNYNARCLVESLVETGTYNPLYLVVFNKAKEQELKAKELSGEAELELEQALSAWHKHRGEEILSHWSEDAPETKKPPAAATAGDQETSIQNGK